MIIKPTHLHEKKLISYGRVKYNDMIRRIVYSLFVTGWLLSACTSTPSSLPTQPTVMPIFQDAAAPAPTPTAPPLQTAPNADAPPDNAGTYREVYLYDEGLAANWSLDFTQNMALDPFDTSHWFEKLDSNVAEDVGAVTLAVTPQKAWGELYFTLRPTTTVSYLRADVQGISFWLNSGDGYLSNDALVVTVVGSNDNPYWLAEDTSALTEVGYFPEIPLYDLAINDAIPPHTWVRIILSMDKLLFGPDYRYVTGIYIKNKSFYDNTFYIDKLALLVNEQ
jgi:hypothetical protein